ncbi:MAG: RimK-like ATPgrasp N-terminal domain-containing protein, partial [Nitrospirota bacterium]|nr:RimK-like ATPgrasp N-terminal domain-containing protein [Nitrospirota bacterium]
YRYQSIGYYVSLLAEARRHKPVPTITTIQDLKSQSIVRAYSDELDELMQKSLAPLQSKEFVLSIYFGRNLAKRYDNLSMHLFRLFPAPFLRSVFAYNEKTANGT